MPPDPRAALRTIRGPEDFADTFGVPQETIERLIVYEKLLRQWQKAVNLVAPSTLDAVWHRHFADSAQLVSLAPPGVRSWIDLGSGGGFPGLVAAIVMAGGSRPSVPSPGSPRGAGWDVGPQDAPTSRGQQNVGGNAAGVEQAAAPLPAEGERGPSPRFILIESDTRKCAFLREVARQTGLSQAGLTVDILSRRAESASLSVNESLPRVVSARALASFERLLGLAAPLAPPGTTLLLLKGREAEKEVSQARQHWQFQVALRPSVTDQHGRIAVVTNLERKAKD
jgi:16S rRNA (guanine527-N7)-methyltransferase